MNANKEPLETHVVYKRSRSEGSEKDVRVLRSGKRAKVHNIVPQEMLMKRKETKMKKKENQQVGNIPQNQTSTQMNSLAYQNPQVFLGSEVKAEDLLKAKLFTCSLEQLMPLKGVRSKVFQLTKGSYKRQPNRTNTKQEAMNVY